MSSSVSRLRSALCSLTERITKLIRTVPIERRKMDRGVIVIAPNYYWGKASHAQLNEQLQIKREYELWIQTILLLFRGSTVELERRIRKRNKNMRIWVELGQNWSLTSNRDENESNLFAASKQLDDLLEILASKSGERIIIPDTNAIINDPDPTSYRGIAGNDRYTFLLLPTVLAELDSLKHAHREKDFREKARKVVARIKGWRRQGSLPTGVTVHKTITVRAIGIEPDMKNSLSWLDRENRDDRIIASVLEVQSACPTSDVILVTEDVNLLNKAEVASIEATELADHYDAC